MYQEKQIKNITENELVIVSGTVISSDPLTIDDGTSQITINSNKIFKENDYLRVFGRNINNSLNAEIIQEMNNIDRKLHQKVINLLQ